MQPTTSAAQREPSTSANQVREEPTQDASPKKTPRPGRNLRGASKPEDKVVKQEETRKSVRRGKAKERTSGSPTVVTRSQRGRSTKQR